MHVRVGRAATVVVPEEQDAGLWVPLDALVAALGWHVTDLGEGRVGVCPDDDRCLPVPAEALRSDDGSPRIRLDHLAETLGLVMERQGDRVAVVPHSESAGITAGSAAGLTLADARTGDPVPLESGRRRCVFAWASW